LEGPPELVIEVAASSVSHDLHQKLGAYRRNGVTEYLVHRVDDGEVDWFMLDRGAYVRQQPEPDGMLKSRQFPGLWLDVPALLRGDLRALRTAIERGLADPAHAPVVQRLARSELLVVWYSVGRAIGCFQVVGTCTRSSDRRERFRTAAALRRRRRAGHARRGPHAGPAPRPDGRVPGLAASRTRRRAAPPRHRRALQPSVPVHRA